MYGNTKILWKDEAAMKSILEEFACGNISPEPRFIKRNSEYEKAVNTLSDTEEKLRVVLNDAGRELLSAFLDAQGAVNHMTNIDKFVYGYRLGALMTMEVLSDKEDLLTGGAAK